MYVKNQNWTNYNNSIIPDFTYSILCEDEKVEVISTMKYMISVWEPEDHIYRRIGKERRVSKIIKNGKNVYIERSALTTKKPKYTYSIRNCNKEFVVSVGTYLYEKPYKKSNKIKLNTELCIATIGQTNKWYQVYYHGKAYFIKKDCKNIKDIHDTEFPNIEVENSDKNCINRVKYYYSMMPKKIRDMMLDFTINVSNDSYNENIGQIWFFKKKIWLREDDSYSLEYAFFHEIGHEIYRLNLPETDLTYESNNLALSTYHSVGKEFYAEGFELYIKQYDMLKNKAPDLFNYYEQIVGW